MAFMYTCLTKNTALLLSICNYDYKREHNYD